MLIAYCLRPFARSVLFGSIAGAFPFLLISIVLAIAGIPRIMSDGTGLIYLPILALLPLAISTPIVLVASIVVGLPIAAMLKRRNRETLCSYAGYGTIAGVIVSLAIVWAVPVPEGEWLSMLGGISGMVTGITWWNSACADFPEGVGAEAPGLPDKL